MSENSLYNSQLIFWTKKIDMQVGLVAKTTIYDHALPLLLYDVNSMQ